MRHRSGRFPRRLTPAGRITSSVTALGLLAAGGLAVVIGTSFAGGSANLVANPGFEKDTAGWSALKAPQHLDRVAGGHSGSYAAKLWSTSAGTVVLKDSPNSVTSTVKGAVYHVSAWVSTTTPSVDAVLRIREVGGAALVGQHSKQVRLKSGGWQELAFDYTAAASGDQLDYNVLARSLASGHSLLVDDAWLSVSSTPVSTPTTSKASPTTTATPSPPATPAPAPSDPPTVTPTPTQAPPPPPPVTSGTLFGTSVYQEPGETFATAWQRRATEFGKLPVDRVFYPGLPKSWPGNAGYSGTTVAVSFKATPQEVNSGAYDATLAAWFQGAPRDRDIYWTYYHEPEDNIEAGAFTAADYRAAWTRIAALADKAQNPRLHPTLILMCFTLSPGSGRTFSDYYPGSSVIDVLAFDCYNQLWAKGQYIAPSTQFAAVLSLSQSLGKPFAVTEFGSQLASGDPTGAGRAAWLRESGSWLSQHGAKFVTYFDSPVSAEYRLMDAPSLTAWKAVINQAP